MLALSGPDAAQTARLLAFAVPAALLGGAYVGQYGFGLWPCEMCWWQRYAHFAALGFATLALLRPSLRNLAWPAGLAILIGGLIGAFHAGVEYKWWEGFTSCTVPVAYSQDVFEAIAQDPMVRCDEVQWSLFGISLAGFNFLISVPAALAVFALLRRSQRGAA